mmetsp:Transcript_35200/g.76956  ORF Transcript_35200/g.76956 Transcript_35200/m.76956 type:complete len:356 (-) Transcript_35200:272-1339(-)|eukprot:CAMPEP_0118941466 /NCGR_PEP_ID=MMETSP1169-20130426/33928_1 /TAXON_ID=36882 /ORGANISM="Pyramimonas obovata, Strain CCMP722" /LENGTH=355 /DNA_ID=CAMNT_0006886219 /DNA_START=13 /DNA_END=1080 /DNA_ORIENTATION=-
MDVWWGSLLPTPAGLTLDPATLKIEELSKRLHDAQNTINDLSVKLKETSAESEEARDTVRQLQASLFEAQITKDSDEKEGQANSSGKEFVDVPLNSTSKVLCHLKNNIGTITMNDPSKLNSFSNELVSDLLSALDAFERSTTRTRVVILRAQPGVKVWSIGHESQPFQLTGEMQDIERPVQALLKRIKEYPIPVIGALEGSLWGAACDVAACCDMLVGTPNTTFSMTCAKQGVPHRPAGANYFSGVLPAHVIKHMYFTGRPLAAEAALRVGFLNEVVPPNHLQATANNMACEVAGNAPLVVSLLKRELSVLGTTATPTDLALEAEDLRRRAYDSYDRREGTTAVLEGRRPVFKGE